MDIMIAGRSVGTQTPGSFLMGGDDTPLVELECTMSHSMRSDNNRMVDKGINTRTPKQSENPAGENTATFSSPDPPGESAPATNNGITTSPVAASAKEKASSASTYSSAKNTSSNSGSKEAKDAIFSPKSAANALTSLFSQGSADKANPRQVFPSMATSSPEAATAPPTPASTTTSAAEEGMSPSANSQNNNEEATTPADAEKTTANTSPPQQSEAETPSTSASSTRGGSPQCWDMPPSHRKGGMPGSHHHYHHPAGPSPHTVYYTFPPGACYSEAPNQWGGGPHHPQYGRGPWTPIVGGKVPGGTPHHPAGPAAFAWDPSRGMMGHMMEQPPPHIMYQNYPYGPPPPQPPGPPPQQQEGAVNTKDGSDPNSAVRSASNNTSLVTPTPKKAKIQGAANASGQQAPPPPQHATLVHMPPHQVVAVQTRPPAHLRGLPLNPHHHAHHTVYATVAMPPHPSQAMVHHPTAAALAPEETPSEAPQAPAAAQPASACKPPTGPSYSRKKKSLGVLADNFLSRYQHCTAGTEVIVDEAAQELGVERRRIYDVVNILESIQLVVKKGKNTYTWMGKETLPDIFGKLQAQAIAEYPDDAIKYGLKEGTPAAEGDDDGVMDDSSITTGGSTTTGGTRSLSRRGSMCSQTSDESKASFRSLAKLSQQFLQVFLVGYDVLSLPQASEMIQGTLSPEAYAAIGTAHAHIASRFDPTAGPPPSLDNPQEFRRAAQRGLKTKIRRLYDIANVFLSVGILRKVENMPANTMEALSNNRRPNFAWAFEKGIKEIQKLYDQKVASGQIQSSPESHPKLLCLPQKIVGITATPLTVHPSQAPTPLSKNTCSKTHGKTPSSSSVSSSLDDRTPPTSAIGEELESGSKSDSGDRTANGDILSRIHQSGACYQTPSLARSAEQADKDEETETI